MARVVDGKIMLGVADAAVVDVLLDAEAANAARDREKKREPAPAPVRAANTG